MSVSVITIVRDRAEHLQRLVDGVVRCRPPAEELVIVDMGSSPAVQVDDAGRVAGVVTTDEAGGGPGEVPPIHTVRMEHSAALPLAAARNLGAQVAGGTRLIFLDVDCIPAPDLVGTYRNAPDGVLACGPVRYLRAGWKDRSDDCADPLDLRARSDDHELRPAPTDDTVDDRYELFWSLSFGVDRHLWDRLGGFDEGFVGYGGEDTDLAFRAREQGTPLSWLSTGTAFHQWHASTDPPTAHLTDIVGNARRFYAKWGRWPMEGWLGAFAEQGLVQWRPDGPSIELSNLAVGVTAR